MVDRLDTLTTGEAAPSYPRPATLWQRIPWWARVGGVYLLARVLTLIALAVTATQLTSRSRAGAHPDFFSYTALWDGYWYWYIAAVGYPSVLPLDDAGHIDQNQWAFLPVYPMLVSGVAALTNAWWPVAAFFVSLLAGLGAALVLYRLFRLRLDEDRAFFAVVLFSISPLSFILQMAYAEALQLFLLTIVLYLFVRRRWRWLFPVIALLALTRPTGLALALALGLYWIYRLRSRRRDPFDRPEQIVVGALAVFSGVMGMAWPLVAWVVTGTMGAYTDTELAWRVPLIGYQHLVPFAPWLQGFGLWFGQPLGGILLVLLVAAAAGAMFLPAVRRLGIEMRLWTASYALYLLAVFFPQSSTFRLLMPMFPLAGALAAPRSPVYRASLVLVSLALQFFWLWVTWGPVASWWSVP